MVDKRIIVDQIEAIEKHLVRIGTYAHMPERQFLADPDAQDIVEYNLFQIVNHLIDMVQHIVVDENLGFPESAYDAAEILFQRAVFSQWNCDALGKMIGFRNIVGHDYIAIDKSIVHRTMTTELEDIRRIVAIIADKYL